MDSKDSVCIQLNLRGICKVEVLAKERSSDNATQEGERDKEAAMDKNVPFYVGYCPSGLTFLNQASCSNSTFSYEPTIKYQANLLYSTP